ncbi:MAG: hypothetical protein ACK5PQ_03505 [Alphaproteobacteria bacterium]
MKKTTIIFLGLFFTMAFDGFSVSINLSSLGPSPYERLRYNSRFCKTDLNRVVSALSKSYTHKGCLKTALKKLQDPKSKLYRQFDYPMPGSKEIKVNNIILIQKHRGETRDILIGAIERRLNPKTLYTENTKLLKQADFREDLLREEMGEFCARQGNFKVFPGMVNWEQEGEWTGDHKPDFESMNVGLILLKIHEINPYHLIEEYRHLLNSLERLKNIDPQKKKNMVSRLKKIRLRLLFILDNLVVLKKRASLEKYKGGRKAELLKERKPSIEAFVNLRSTFDHVQTIDEAFKALQSKKDVTKIYPHLFNLYVFVWHLNDINNQCLGVQKKPSGK